MSRSRIALGAVALAAVAVSLTACEKPNPGASVFSGTTSEWRTAACWSDSGSIDPNECAKDVIDNASSGSRLAEIPVVPGQVVGISVDPVVADAGWTPRINGQPLSSTPLTSTYYRFTYPEFQAVPEDGILMELVAGDEGDTKGLWLFQLMPAS